MSDLTQGASERAARSRLRKKANRRVPYGEYLRTADWDTRRREVLRRAGYKCQFCGAAGVPLRVHHLTYERRGNERYADLRAICRQCHEKAHGIAPDSPAGAEDALDAEEMGG